MPTNATKRQAVLTLLQEPAWQQRSTREIAKRSGVSHAYIIKLRRETDGNVTSAAPSWNIQDATPSTAFMLPGETLLSAGVSPALGQRIRNRLNQMPPAQRQPAEQLLEKLLL